MARFKLAEGKELSSVGRSMYNLAVGKLTNFPGESQTQLEAAVTGNFVKTGKAVSFVYDTPDELFIVVPDLSAFGSSAPPEGTTGLDKFANEALGFVVIFGCGP